MFKFSTTTLLNGLKTTIEAYKDENGVQRIVDNTSATDPSITIHRLGKFTKSNVTAIYKREGTEGTAGQAVITCATATNPSTGTTASVAGVYRLKLYVKLSGNNDAFYANDFVFKGKPYVYEFAVKSATATAKDVADAAETAINHLASRFNDKVFKVVNDGAGKLTITTVGADNVYRSITECVLQKFDATVNTALIGGEYVDVVEGVLTPCVNPFGTYGELIKDLRLPTPEHTGWSTILKDEQPELGVVYNQYLIYMCVNRDIMGGDAVGEPTKSVTAHSIWVPLGAGATVFEGLLAELGTVNAYTSANLSSTQDSKTAFTDNVKAEPQVTE